MRRTSHRMGSYPPLWGMNRLEGGMPELKAPAPRGRYTYGSTSVNCLGEDEVVSSGRSLLGTLRGVTMIPLGVHCSLQLLKRALTLCSVKPMTSKTQKCGLKTEPSDVHYWLAGSVYVDYHRVEPSPAELMRLCMVRAATRLVILDYPNYEVQGGRITGHTEPRN